MKCHQENKPQKSLKIIQKWSPKSSKMRPKSRSWGSQEHLASQPAPEHDLGSNLDAIWTPLGVARATSWAQFWYHFDVGFWRPFSIPLRSSIFIDLGCILASISASISQPFVNIFLLWRSARNAVNSSKNQCFWCLQHHVFHRFWDRFSNLDARSRFDLKKLSFGLCFGSVLGSFWRAEGYQFRIENSTWFPFVFMSILEGGRIWGNMVRGG